MGETDRRQCVVWVSQKITLEVICLFIDLFFIGLEFANKLFVHLVPELESHSGYINICHLSVFFYLTWVLYRIPVLLFIRQILCQLSYLLSCLQFIYSDREIRG